MLEQILVKFESKYTGFHEVKSLWKYHFQKTDIVSTSMR